MSCQTKKPAAGSPRRGDRMPAWRPGTAGDRWNSKRTSRGPWSFYGWAGLVRKTVALPVDGHDIAGILGIVFDLLAQPGDVHIDGARQRDGLVSPYFLKE